MSTALDYELDAAAGTADVPISDVSVPRQGPKQHKDDVAPAKPTSAAAWKRDLPETHTLPSGNVAVLQRPQMTELMKLGKIPNTLIDAALSMTTNGTAPVDGYDEVVELLDFLVAAAFVEPKISVADEPAEDELPISALSDADRNYVLIWAQRGVAGLRRFRLDGSGPADLGDGGDVRDEAE